jgi:hypothetical protein
MLPYSHIWDGLLKLASVTALVLLLMQLHFEERIESLGLSSNAAVFLFVVTVTAVWIAVYRQGLSTISAWLYARVNLGAPVTLSEARRLARLFQLDLSFKWIPLKEVRRLPKSERRNALRMALNAMEPSRKAMLL